MEITRNTKEIIQEPTRELIQMFGIWKTNFHRKTKQNKTKTAVPEDETIPHVSKLKYTEIHKRGPQRSCICQESYSGERNKRNEMNRKGTWIWLHEIITCFALLFAVIQKETEGIFQLFQTQGHREKEFELLWIRPDITL